MWIWPEIPGSNTLKTQQRRVFENCVCWLLYWFWCTVIQSPSETSNLMRIELFGNWVLCFYRSLNRMFPENLFYLLWHDFSALSQMTNSLKMALFFFFTVFCVKQMKVFDIRAYLGFVPAHEGSTVTISCKVNASGHFETWKKNR